MRAGTSRHSGLAFRGQAGLAALAAILLLLGGTLIAVAYASRVLITEQRSAAAHLQAGIALEAAQAGVDWALIHVNRPLPLDAACQVTAPELGVSLAARLLGVDLATGTLTALPRPGVVGCDLASGNWACDCAGAATSVLPPPAAGLATAGFRLALAASPRPGTVRLTSTGCSDVAALCTAGGTTVTRVSLLLGMLPTLKSPPAAPLLATGRIELASDLALGNSDVHTHGLLAAAGGAITGTPIVAASLAGTPTSLLLQSHSAPLQAAAALRFFEQHVGLDRSRWARLPSVMRVQCPAGDCGADLMAAQSTGARMMHVEGGFEIDAHASPQVLGAADAPLFIVAGGPVVWRGAVRFTGVLWAPSLDWHAAGAQRGSVRGALLVGGDARLLAPADIGYDAGVMAMLARTGTLVAVPGSWHDF